MITNHSLGLPSCKDSERPQFADTVCAALGQTLVAAVGPVVAGALERHGVRARLMPEESFFLKPLTTALEEALRAHP